MGKNLKMDRATCSYSRCSLNEHVDALLPPLKSFVSARRQAQARPTKGSGKLIGRDEAATSDGGGEMWRDIDPRSWAQKAETETLRRPCIGSCDMDTEKGKHDPTYLVYDYECTFTSAAEFMMSADERLGNFFDEMSVDEVSQELFDEESLNSDTLFDGEEHDLKHESLPTTEMGNQAPHPLEMPDKSSIEATIKHKSNLQEADEFNPREAHLLPLEADPEAEKVRLRHQEVDARKNGEEWMVDYALREAIGPTRQRKVASLVQAFERLLPTTKT